MGKNSIATGVAHRVPADLRETLTSVTEVKMHGMILHHLRVMNGYAGLHPSKSGNKDKTY